MASYKGNLNFHEIYAFYDAGTSKHIQELESLLEEDKVEEACKLVHRVTGSLLGEEEEKIPGGLSSGKTIQDVATHHDVDLKELRKELNRGVRVEMEHTPHRNVAKEIALDHLFEDPKYYTKLKNIEESDLFIEMKPLTSFSPQTKPTGIKYRTSPDTLDTVKNKAKVGDEIEVVEDDVEVPGMDPKTFSVEETKNLGVAVGRGVKEALLEIGEEMVELKLKNIQPGSFTVYVQYKNRQEDSFNFHLDKLSKTLHLQDEDVDKDLVQVGFKPSGEPLISIPVLKDALVTHWQTMQEGYRVVFKEGTSRKLSTKYATLQECVSAAVQLNRKKRGALEGIMYGRTLKEGYVPRNVMDDPIGYLNRTKPHLLKALRRNSEDEEDLLEKAMEFLLDYFSAQSNKELEYAEEN